MIEPCRAHPDEPAAIVFQKPGKSFGYCTDCIKRSKEGVLLGLILGHGYIASTHNDAALYRDAARYRWMRTQGMRWKKRDEIAPWEKEEELDRSIDTAIAEAQP